MMSNTVWLLDAPIYIFRAWFGMPDRWRDSNGRALNAVIGFANTVIGLLETMSSKEPFLAAFDESLGTNYRNEIYSCYKKSRSEPDSELIFQFEACKSILAAIGVPVFCGSRYEADDYIASLSKVYKQAHYKVKIVTRDKDLSQLIVSSDCVCFDPISNKVTDEDVFRRENGISPSQLVDLMALVGDPVDDIPGVRGIGRKTAVTLLSSFGSLEGLKSHIDSDAELDIRGQDRVKTLIKRNWNNVLLSRELVRLFDSIPEVTYERLPARSSSNLRKLERMLRDWHAPDSVLVRCQKLIKKSIE